MLLAQFRPAAFGRLCVETRSIPGKASTAVCQPPSGGCVLKLRLPSHCRMAARPAAFGRLCVETSCFDLFYNTLNPAAFGRLCVETVSGLTVLSAWLPAAFGRLCVETVVLGGWGGFAAPAAFGRLCVETQKNIIKSNKNDSSRLRAAVC